MKEWGKKIIGLVGVAAFTMGVIWAYRKWAPDAVKQTFNI